MSLSPERQNFRCEKFMIMVTFCHISKYLFHMLLELEEERGKSLGRATPDMATIVGGEQEVIL